MVVFTLFHLEGSVQNKTPPFSPINVSSCGFRIRYILWISTFLFIIVVINLFCLFFVYFTFLKMADLVNDRADLFIKNVQTLIDDGKGEMEVSK